MKKTIRLAILTVLILALGLAVLNIEVTTRKGINGDVYNIKIPLYLKTLDFLDRHYNYKILTDRIVKGSGSAEERALRILNWTYNNIKRNPKDLPVVDDHPWYIIVRGYGLDDQFQDVFTTLCNHVHLDAFFYKVPLLSDQRKGKVLSFVKFDYGWAVFDAYRGIYFKNAKGDLATVDDISTGNWKAVSISDEDVPDFYGMFFENLRSVDYNRWKSSRAAIQSPFRRLIYFFTR